MESQDCFFFLSYDFCRSDPRILVYFFFSYFFELCATSYLSLHPAHFSIIKCGFRVLLYVYVWHRCCLKDVILAIIPGISFCGRSRKCKIWNRFVRISHIELVRQFCARREDENYIFASTCILWSKMDTPSASKQFANNYLWCTYAVLLQ